MENRCRKLNHNKRGSSKSMPQGGHPPPSFDHLVGGVCTKSLYFAQKAPLSGTLCAKPPQALEQRRPHPADFQGRLRGRRPLLLQPAQLQEDLGASRGPNLQVSRRVQGLVPKPRPRERFDDVLELRGTVARHRQAEIIRSLGKSEQHACISSSSLIVLPAKGIFDGATS